MIHAGALSRHRYQNRGADLLLLALAGLCMLTVPLWTLLSSDVVQSLVMALALLSTLFAAVLIWRQPQIAVYTLFAAAVVVEVNPLGSGLSITAEIPAFRNLQTLLPIPGVILNPIECLSIFTVGLLVLKSRVTRDVSIVGGPLMLPFAMLLGIIMLGVVRGYMAGGDVKIALWGIRAFVLMFMAYWLSVNLMRRPDQARLLFVILLVGVALKGLIGLWRYVVDFGGRVQATETGVPGNALMAHEESFFFLVVLFLVLVSYAFHLPKRDRQMALFTLAIAIVPLLANQRRVAIAALLIGVVLLLVLLYVLEPQRRKAILAGVLIVLALMPMYAFVTWNSTAIYASPTQAIKSQFQPSARDASSNTYREIENINLRATAKQSPLLGAGFGLPMVQERVLPDIGDSYEWYLYLPHNGLLWLASTIGVVGLAAFAYLMAVALLKNVVALRASLESPHLRALFAMSILSLAVFLMFVLYDQGLLSQRICIYIGVMLGLLPLAPRLVPDRLERDHGAFTAFTDAAALDAPSPVGVPG